MKILTTLIILFAFNLNQASAASPFAAAQDSYNDSLGIGSDVRSLGNIINTVVPYLIILGGIALFIMLIAGGFTMLTSATNPDNAQKGKQQITMAIAGFIIMFSAYWIVQILEIVLGINIF